MSAHVHRRAAMIVVAVVVVVAGLTLHETTDGWVGAFTGDALYAVLIFAIVAVVRPAASSAVAGAVALAVCAAVEALQLTGVPAHLSATIPGVELVLGSTFQWTDLLAYALGATIAALVDGAVRRRGGGSSPDGPTTPSAGAPARRPRAGTPSR